MTRDEALEKAAHEFEQLLGEDHVQDFLTEIYRGLVPEPDVFDFHDDDQFNEALEIWEDCKTVFMLDALEHLVKINREAKEVKGGDQ